VSSTAEAAEYVHTLVGDEIARLEDEAAEPDAGQPALVVDLGCGVGGTVLSLARRFPNTRFHGVTVSERQVEVARRLAVERGLQGRVAFEEDDFVALRLNEPADAAIAIESFVHGDDPERFFAAASANLRNGGLLLLVDDFLSMPEEELGERVRRIVRDFRAGWHLPSLTTTDALRTVATGAGLELVKDVDLTELIRPGRLRDRVLAVLSPVFRGMGLAEVPFFGNMIGGNALQIGIREGFLQYRFQVWRKRPGKSPATPPASP